LKHCCPSANPTVLAILAEILPAGNGVIAFLGQAQYGGFTIQQAGGQQHGREDIKGLDPRGLAAGAGDF
jgi:hypothetical protein